MIFLNAIILIMMMMSHCRDFFCKYESSRGGGQGVCTGVTPHSISKVSDILFFMMLSIFSFLQHLLLFFFISYLSHYFLCCLSIHLFITHSSQSLIHSSIHSFISFLISFSLLLHFSISSTAPLTEKSYIHHLSCSSMNNSGIFGAILESSLRA